MILTDWWRFKQTMEWLQRVMVRLDHMLASVDQRQDALDKIQEELSLLMFLWKDLQDTEIGFDRGHYRQRIQGLLDRVYGA